MPPDRNQKGLEGAKTHVASETLSDLPVDRPIQVILLMQPGNEPPCIITRTKGHTSTRRKPDAGYHVA